MTDERDKSLNILSEKKIPLAVRSFKIFIKLKNLDLPLLNDIHFSLKELM